MTGRAPWQRGAIEPRSMWLERHQLKFFLLTTLALIRWEVGLSVAACLWLTGRLLRPMRGN